MDLFDLTDTAATPLAAMSLVDVSVALRAIRTQEPHLAAVKASVDASKAYRADGHRSAHAWLRAEQNFSPGTAAADFRPTR